MKHSMAAPFWSIIFISLTAATAKYIVPNPEAACSSIASIYSNPNVTINFSQYLSAGTNLSLDQSTPELRSCTRPSQVIPADLCRVAMYVSTSNQSGITLEAWLPTNWTGRFLTTGNGGLSGCIQYEDIAYGNELGFATVGANNGHNGTSGEAFGQNDDVIADFAYRSVQQSAVIGKAITDAYYQRTLNATTSKSYYLGCSTGGRQGFKLAQDYPDLFDGIVAGAPALSFNNLNSWGLSFLPITGDPTSPTYLPPSKWALVQRAVLDHCDALDGARDSILEDPNLCTFQPVTLACPASTTNTTTCLTPPQLRTVTQILAPYYGENGALIYPRPQPGAEASSAATYYTGAPFAYGTDWMRYAILHDPTWAPQTMNVSFAALSARTNPFNIATWSGDLSRFRDRGARLLHWHGLADPVISSEISQMYYAHVAETMGLAPGDLDGFYRYFRVSGTGHCWGGVGAGEIGQETGAGWDPERNVLVRLVEWVEKGEGEAPETIMGVKRGDGGEVVLERRHCRFPRRNVCRDPERYAEADAWECVG